MSKGSPSMIALLGLMAVAGYQNREKLAGMMQGTQHGDATRFDPANPRLEQAGASPLGGIVDSIRQAMSGTGGTGLAGGLSELLGRFTNPVQAAKAQSWLDSGPNGALAPGDLEEVLDEGTLAELIQKTGLSRGDLLDRLSAVLPDAVDSLTPGGRMLTADEARSVY